MSVRDLLECDSQFQVGLQAASQVLSNVKAREECLRKCRIAIDLEKILVKNLTNIENFDTVLSDIQWKETLLDSLPLEPSEDQFRAVLVLVKCQPFLASLS